MNLAQLRGLLAVADEGTFTAAGDALGLTQSGFPSAAQLLPSLIAELGRQMPNVTLVLLEGSDTEVRAWLADRIVDLAAVADLADPAELDTGCPPPGGCSWPPTGSSRYSTPTTPSLASPRSTCTSSSTTRCCCPTAAASRCCASSTTPPRSRCARPRRIRDVATLLAMVREHLGVTVVPELTLPDGHGLAVVPIKPARHRRLFLVPADDELPAAADALLDLARPQHLAPRTSQ